MSISGKQPLYLHEVGVRFGYPTLGITLDLLLLLFGCPSNPLAFGMIRCVTISLSFCTSLFSCNICSSFFCLMTLKFSYSSFKCASAINFLIVLLSPFYFFQCNFMLLFWFLAIMCYILCEASILLFWMHCVLFSWLSWLVYWSICSNFLTAFFGYNRLQIQWGRKKQMRLV